jgi:hypothetical protein
MNSIHRWWRYGSIASLVWLIGGSAGQRRRPRERKVVVRVITEWDNDCDAGNRADWNNMLDSWYDEIANDDARPDGHGNRAWVKDGFHENGNIVDSDFADPSIVPWGNDDGDDRLDEDDVIMVGLHGNEYGNDNSWYGKVRVDEPPDNEGDPNCRAWQHHMLLGNTDLEYLHLSSCHSLCQDNWEAWEGSFAGVHLITGFHGIMYIIPWWPVLYEDFADDAFDVSIALAWIDELYDPEHWYEVWQDGDQCPTAMASDASHAAAWDRLLTEQYNAVLPDPAATGFAHIWVSGCNPDDDPALP